LIVIGAHGVGVVERVFVGSRTERIIREAGYPVLAVGKGDENGPS
jgi:nucleotide-binding universal stress UspA family protein